MIPLFKVSMSSAAEVLVGTTLRSGYIGEGPVVKLFEEKLAQRFGARVLCVNSCTSALDLAYHLIGLGQGERVISSPMTCLATNMPLALRGCDILWADVDPRTGNISPESVAHLVQAWSGVRAIVATDWAGRPCDYAALRDAAPNIPIVEDAAHAFDAHVHGVNIALAGGDYVAWSFQAIKHLTTGDGGALRVPHDQYDRARLLRWYGLDRNNSEAMRCLQQASEPGFKYQMNDIAASIGVANLSEVVEHIGQHRLHAAYYTKALPEEITAPFDSGASYWIYTILVDDPEKFIQYMDEKGIQASQVHTRNDLQDCLPASTHQLPGLDAFSSKMVSIPVGWWLSEEDVTYVADTVRQYVERYAHVTA